MQQEAGWSFRRRRELDGQIRGRDRYGRCHGRLGSDDENGRLRHLSGDPFAGGGVDPTGLVVVGSSCGREDVVGRGQHANMAGEHQRARDDKGPTKDTHYP